MNKVLDLVAAIEDDNFGYTTNVSVPESDKMDYLINCRKHFSAEDDVIRVNFNYDQLNELIDEFEDVSISSFVDRGHIDGIGGDDVFRHEIEIQVVE